MVCGQLDALAHDLCANTDTPLHDYKLRREKLQKQLQGYSDMRAAGEIDQREFIENRDRLRAELATLPDDAPRVRVEYSFDEVRPLLDDLCATIQVAAQIDIAAANRALLSFWERVEFDGEKITRVVWRAPFTRLNDREF